MRVYEGGGCTAKNSRIPMLENWLALQGARSLTLSAVAELRTGQACRSYVYDDYWSCLADVFRGCRSLSYNWPWMLTWTTTFPVRPDIGIEL